MATLHLKNLHCFETEDNTGDDECELRVWCDARYYAFRNTMNNGQSWPLDIQLSFERRAKFQLWDLDAGSWFDRHDFLGTAILRPEPINGGSATFNLDGADYLLDYDVF